MGGTQSTGRVDPAPRRSRFERRKARTANALLDAATRLFLARGCRAATVEDLAAEADVAVGSLYGHFGSKEGLYLAVVGRALELHERYMDEAYGRQEAPPEEQLLAISDAYVRFYREHPGFFRLFVFPPSDGPSPEAMPALAELIAGRIEDETERLTGAIGRAIESGVAREVDARRAATFLWGAWNGVIAMHLRSGRPAMADDELEAVLEQGRLIITVGMLVDPP